MYDVSANINDIELIKQPLVNDFQISLNQLQPYLDMEDVKIIFVCSPNNPTGNCFNDEDIIYILENFNGIVIIDEAYIDFSSKASFITKLNEYPNLIISQTFSKAWGLAGARVGAAYANSAIINLYNKVKPPYNVSTLNQEQVIESLNNLSVFEENKNIILNEKKLLIKAFENLELVQKIYPSDANFILIEVTNATDIYNKLVAQKIITRNRNSLVNNCLRITVGSTEENTQLIKALKSITY